MISQETIQRVTELCNKPVALGGWLGLPYDQNGCLKFAIKLYRELGIDVDERAMREARNFIDTDNPRFGDMAVFYCSALDEPWHVGVMLDHRRMIQCSGNTNGVGKTPVDGYPWAENFRGFKRHKALCS